MNLGRVYGPPPTPAAGRALLLRALELGVTHFDTAALYGFGKNEKLVGATLAPHRRDIFLASKCGMRGVGGKRVIDGRPAALLETCDESLARLRTDHIDLYYLHRFDKSVPIEESVGALSRMVEAGKVRHIGLSEVSAATLARAHAVHPIAAVQTEYSLWTRNPEVAVLEATRKIGAALVAFSPVGRGFLAGRLESIDDLAKGDLRLRMPRFGEPHFAKNLELLAGITLLAERTGCTRAQLVLAWLLGCGEHVVPIPGTGSIAHLEENVAAAGVSLPADVAAELEALVNPATVSGPRYGSATQAEVDTEEILVSA